MRQLLSMETVDVNAQGHEGKTALMYACIMKDEEAARMLLAHPKIDPHQITLEAHRSSNKVLY